MRRVLLFAAFLLLLGLTTATAASFDVQAEDITSFSESVTIVTPPPPPTNGARYYLVFKEGTEQLSTNRADLDSGGGVEDTTLTVGQSLEWSSGPLAGGLVLIGQLVDLQIYTVGGTEGLRGVIYDCAPDAASGSESCPAVSAVGPVDLANGKHDLPMSAPSGDITAGNRLVLRIENAGSGGDVVKIQWGKSQPVRDSNVWVRSP